MGLMFTCAAWLEQVDHFSRKADHAVLVFDNRGVGNSELSVSNLSYEISGDFGSNDKNIGLVHTRTIRCGAMKPYRTSGMAKDVKDLLDFLQWDQDRSLHIFGVSLGGMLSQSLPRAMATLLNIVCKKGPYKKRVDLLLELLYPSSYLNQSTANGQTKRDDLLKYYQTWFDRPQQLPLSGIFGQFCATAFHHSSDSSLKKIAAELYPAKIAVISGNQDELIDPLRSFELRGKLPGSELILFENAGHILNSQAPQQFNLLMERIIAEGNEAFQTKN